MRVWSIGETEGEIKMEGGRTVNSTINESPALQFYLRS